LRIAVNAALIGTRYSGVATCTVGLIDCLSELGHEVVVYGSSPHLAKGKRVKVAKVSPSLAFDKGSIAALLRFMWNQTILPLRLLHDNVDIVISQNTDGSFWSPAAQALVVHDLIPLLYPDEAPRLHSYYNRVLPFVMKRTAAIVAVSQNSRNDLVRRYRLDPAKVHVVYNGLTSALGEPASDDKPAGVRSSRYFLFVGTFAPRKNLETVIRALATVRNEIPESLVVVAYPDRWTASCLRTVGELGLSDRIIHLNGLTNEELTTVYRHATALFLLSEYEGFGFPPLEAMLLGTPAVVSDSTALAEVVGDAALRIKSHDVDAAAEAMRKLSTDQNYRHGLRQLGMQKARTYTWARTAATLDEVLWQIAQQDGKKATTREQSR
jgi:glycosyltransferase involved in cell wall biosynthesis